MNDKYMEAVKEAQRMRDDGSIDGVGKLGYAPNVERDPDSVEQLITQIASQAYDIDNALGTLRGTLLGSYPITEKRRDTSVEGLIPQIKMVLYDMIEIQKNIREHIAVISKGVR